MTKMRIVFTITLFLMLGSSYAQDESKILVTNSVNNSIEIKWFTGTIYTDTPVNVYRQEKGDSGWLKITSSPIKRENEISQSLKDQDQIFSMLEKQIQENRPGDLDGMTKLMIMIKAVEYPPFSDFLGIRYIDSSFTRGKEYRYRITEQTENGEHELNISEWITAAEFKQAPPPDAFTGKQEDYVVSFSWQPDEHQFMGVYIYRTGPGGKPEKLTHVPIIVSVNDQGNYPDILFRDDDLTIGQTYSYQLAEIDYFGRESQLSHELKITIEDVTPPPSPYKVVTDVAGKKVRLYWETVNAPDLAGYNIYRAAHTDTAFQMINQALIQKEYLTYTDTINKTGNFDYKVASVDQSGNEAFSEVYTAEIKDIFPPDKPQMLTLTPDTGQIKLKWQENTEPDLRGYLIYRTIDSDKKNYSLLNSRPVTQNHFTDKLHPGAKNNFLYRIIAIDSAYNKSPYSDFAITRLPDVVAPHQPQIKSITAENNMLIIEWHPVFDADLAGYNILRAANAQIPKKLNINLISGIELFTDRNVRPDILYEYYVTAVDSSGNQSIKSEEFTAGLNIKADFILEFKKFSANYRKRKETILLKWDVRHESPVKGFVVYRRTTDVTHFKPVTGLVKETEYEDKDITEDIEYEYQIRAFSNTNQQKKSNTQKITLP